MTIKILPAELANQIAAGEVVERPASVVKELVENSLDAHATKIEIHINAGGSELIKIVDNGKGIAKDELPLALARHATSKIQSLDDLLAIMSFGFRGEALASISSVSRLTFTSKPKEQSEAWQVYAEGREMNAVLKPAAHPDGTTVEVRNLFYNTPARRKFLRSEKTEFNHIDEVIRRIALARYDVTFLLFSNGKRLRYYPAIKESNSTHEKQARLATICGSAFIAQAKYITWQHFDLAIEGWITLPNQVLPRIDAVSSNQVKDTPRTAQTQYCYVNGRIVRDKVILHAIRQSLHTVAEMSGYQAIPFDDVNFVIYLSVDPEQVDVNVHPAKHEVRFHQNRIVHDFIYQAVLQTMQSAASELDSNRRSAGPNQFITPIAEQEPVNNVEPISNRKLAEPPSPSYDFNSSSFDRAHDKNNASVDDRPNQASLASSLHQAIFPKNNRTFKPSFSQPNPTKSLSIQKQEIQLYGQLANQPEPVNFDQAELNRTEPAIKETPSTQINQPALDRELFANRETFGKALYVVNQHFLLLVSQAVCTEQKQDSCNKTEMLSLLDLNVAEKLLMSARLKLLIDEKRSQPLLVPVKIVLKPAEWAVFQSHKAIFENFLFQYEEESRSRTIILNGVAALFRHLDVAKLFLLLLHKIAESGSTLNEALLIDWLANTVKNGVEIEYASPSLNLNESQESVWGLSHAITLIGELERLRPDLIASPPERLLKLIPSSFSVSTIL